MKFLVTTALILGFIFGFCTANAGDKVNNGGGLWACVSPSQEVLKGTLVDLYEARTEFGLIMITSTEANPMNIVKERENYLRTNSSRYLREWSLALAEVLQKMRLVDAELERVDDSLFRMRPLPTTCAGTWNYVQFANFTYLNQVLVRQDMWNTPTIPSLDKAALIWHEAIYKWLRDTQHDKDSVRARQIVGLIFAKISPRELEEGVAAVLNQSTPPPPPPPPPTKTSVCFMKNTMNQMWHMEYGNSEAGAKANVISNCQSAEGGYHCDTYSIRCDSFQSDALPTIVASVRNGLTQKNYTGEGRSKAEAEGKARKACSDEAGPHTAVHCSEPVWY